MIDDEIIDRVNEVKISENVERRMVSRLYETSLELFSMMIWHFYNLTIQGIFTGKICGNTTACMIRIFQ